MKYQILLDPALGISASELAAAWAELPECTQEGKCRADGAAIQGFSIDIADTATVAAITIGTTLAKDLIVELVKRALDRAGASKASAKSADEVIIEQMPDAQTGLPLLMRATLKK